LRRGTIADVFGVLIIGTVAISTFFVAAVVWQEFRGGLNSTLNTTGQLSQQENQIYTSGTNTQNTLINLIPFLIVGSGLATVVLAWLIPTHPIFMPLSIIVGAVFVWLSTAFANIWNEFLTAPSIVTYSNNFPLIASITQYLPWIVTAIVILIMVVQYSQAGKEAAQE
jgi:hypothetical protein